MSYMWEVLLKSEAIGVAKHDIQFTPARVANPYREAFFSDVNEDILTEAPIEVNYLYRYASVFASLVNKNFDGYEQLRQQLFDILMHFLSDLDLREGLCRDEFYAKFLREDFESGLFDKKTAKAIRYFSPQQASVVLGKLLKVYKSGESLDIFGKLLRELYPNSIIYLDSYNQLELLIYVGKKKTDELEFQLEFLCDVFLPIRYEVKLFWEFHFGIMGVDETMQIGQIMMY